MQLKNILLKFFCFVSQCIVRSPKFGTLALRLIRNNIYFFNELSKLTDGGSTRQFCVQYASDGL